MTKLVITKTNTRTIRSKVTCVPEATGTVPALCKRSVNILTTTLICKCSKVNTAANKGSKDMFVLHSDHVYMCVFNRLQKSYLPAVSSHKHTEQNSSNNDWKYRSFSFSCLLTVQCDFSFFIFFLFALTSL